MANFQAHHPELTLRTADNLEHSHANALTRDVVNNNFTCLKTTLHEDSNFINAPCQLFNCDVIFLPLNIAKVITRKYSRHVYAQLRGTSEHITLLCCASAAGVALPPTIIYSKSFPGCSYRFDRPDDAVYAKSESGWTESEPFLSVSKALWFTVARFSLC